MKKYFVYFLFTFIISFIFLLDTNASQYGTIYSSETNKGQLRGTPVCVYEDFTYVEPTCGSHTVSQARQDAQTYSFITKEKYVDSNRGNVYHFYAVDKGLGVLLHLGFLDSTYTAFATSPDETYFSPGVHLYDLTYHSPTNHLIAKNNSYFDEKVYITSDKSSVSGKPRLDRILYMELEQGTCPHMMRTKYSLQCQGYYSESPDDIMGLSRLEISRSSNSEYYPQGGLLTENHMSSVSSNSGSQSLEQINKDVKDVVSNTKQITSTTSYDKNKKGTNYCIYTIKEQGTGFPDKFQLTPVITKETKNNTSNYWFYYIFVDHAFDLLYSEDYSKNLSEGSKGLQISAARLTWNPSSEFYDTYAFGWQRKSTRENTRAYDKNLLDNLLNNGTCPKYIIYDATKPAIKNSVIGGTYYFTDTTDGFDSSKRHLLFVNSGDGSSIGTTTQNTYRYQGDPFIGVKSMNSYTLSPTSSNTSTTYYEKEIMCKNFEFCKTYGVLKTFEISGKIINIIKIIVPILIIIFGSIDFAKVVISHDADELNKSISSFVRKLILGVVVFLIPTIINSIISFVGINSDPDKKFLPCTQCLTNDKKCSGNLATAKQSQESGKCYESYAVTSTKTDDIKNEKLVCLYHKDSGMGTFYVTKINGQYYLKNTNSLNPYIAPPTDKSNISPFIRVENGSDEYLSFSDSDLYNVFSSHIRNRGCYSMISRYGEDGTFSIHDVNSTYESNDTDLNVVRCRNDKQNSSDTSDCDISLIEIPSNVDFSEFTTESVR